MLRLLSLTLPILLLAGHIAGDAFVPGQQYTYLYNGRIATGIPGVQKQYSGLSLDYKVIIQARTDHLVIKFDDVKVDKVNKQAYTLNHHEFNYKPSVEYTEHLSKPFKVYYEEGMVKKFYVEREEPEWSVNIKKAILTTLQINLRQYNPMRIQKGNYLVKPDPSANYFRVMEDGVVGECETMYNIMSIPDVETPYHNNVLNVTKTRNYSNCKHVPIAIYSSVLGTKCVECGPEVEKNDPWKSYATTKYNLRGDRYHFLIERAETEGETVFTPYTTNGESIITYVNHTLVLDEVKRTPQIITPDSDLIALYTLSYKFPSKIQFRDLVDLKQPHSIYASYGHQVDPSVVGSIFETIARSYKNINVQENLNNNYTTKYAELVKHFSTLSYDKINRLYNQYADYNYTAATQEQRAKLRLFLNVLADVGTNPSYAFVKQLIQTNRITRAATSSYFQKISFSIKEPTETLFDDIYRLCSHHAVSRNRPVQRACYLTFATLVRRHCVRPVTTRPTSPSTYDRSCTPEITEKYVNYIEQKYDQSHTLMEKSVFLAALEAISSQKAISILKPIVQGESREPIVVRQEAIWALYRGAGRYPEEVFSVVSPVFFNKTEDHELRIAAFTVLIASQPSLYHFYDFVKVVKFEEDRNVQNYVYTALQYLSNSTHPCHVNIGEHAKLAFETLKASNFTPVFSPGYSFMYTSGGYEPKYNYGGFTSLQYIASNVSYIPRSIHLTMNDYIGGISTEPLEFGYRGQGLERIVDKIFGPEGIFYKKDSVFDVLSRKPRSTDNIKKELKEIQEALSLSPREYEPIAVNVHLVRYGVDLYHYQFDETTFQDFLSKDTFPIQDIFGYLKNGFEYHHQIYSMSHNALYEMPTEFGLSTVLDIQVPTLTSMNFNQVKIKVEPSVFARDRSLRPPTSVQVSSDGKISTDTVQLITTSVLSPFEKIKYGAGYEHRSLVTIPLKGSITYDVANAKLSTEYEPSQEKVFHTHFEPTTFIDNYANQVGLQEEKSYQPIGIHKFRYDSEKDFGHELFGIGVQTKSLYYGFYYDTPSYLNFFRNNDWRSIIYYYWSNPQFRPYKYSVKVTPATSKQTQKITTVFNLKYHHLAKQEAYAPVYAQKNQEFESYSTSEQSRRPQTISVVANVKTVGSYERKLDAELVYQWSYDYLFHRYGLYVERNAYTDTDSSPKLCVDAQIRLPPREWQKIIALRIADINTKVKSKVSVNWGSNCNSDKKISVVIDADRTEEQIQYIRDISKLRSHYQSQSYPYYRAYPHPAQVGYNPYADLYYRCTHQKSTGFVMNYDCLEFVQRATELRKFDSTIKYQKIPEYFSNFTTKAYSLFNVRVFPHIDYYFSTALNRAPGQITIRANASVHYPVFDAEVKMPMGNVNYEKVYEPLFYPSASIYPYAITHGYYQQYFTNYKHLTYSVCTFDKYVQTFVNTTYEAPFTGCYHVVAKDCSTEEAYTVLLAKTSESSEYKNLRILLKEHSVELLPYGGALKIRVDGKAVPVKPSEPYFQYRNIGSTRYLDFVVRIVDGIYFVDAPQTGLYLQFDGKNGGIFLSNYYRGKQCGMCGNINGRVDFTQYSGPDNCYYTNTTAFTYSYAVPTSQCKVPKFEKSIVCDVNPFRSTYPEEVCTPMRNRIIYGEDFDQQVCFSTKPLPECNRRCRPTRMLSKSVEFHCLSTRDDYAQRLISLRDRRVLYEFNNKQGDKRAEIQYPESCTSEYQY